MMSMTLKINNMLDVWSDFDWLFETLHIWEATLCDNTDKKVTILKTS